MEVVADGVLLRTRRPPAHGPDDRAPRLVGVDATLRAYQGTGVAWLQALGDLGLGALLADDMGLGKTLQTIALLAGRAGDRPHAGRVPDLGGRQLGARAGPLRPGPPRAAPPRPRPSRATRSAFPAGTVVVTTYGLLRRDADLLAEVEWDVVVLDEAQQIKNPAARTARAARRLTAASRVALTGTPVENRLAELWSIMEFANPGLLGSFARFRERYAVPVERWRDHDAAARLRRVVAPFMLRRTKTDPAIAADLPPKIEATVACTLTREQATLYQAAVRTLLDQDGLGEGIERRGRVLALLTALKQICNHPAQYLGEAGPLAGRSGKLARITEMLAEVVDAGDRALVFTQYREMGELLVRHLTATLGLASVPFLHGGVARGRRDAMVAGFQDGVGAAAPDRVAQGRRHRAQPDRRHPRRPLRPVVEPGRRGPGHRPRLPDRPGPHRATSTSSSPAARSRSASTRCSTTSARWPTPSSATGETWLTELSDDDIRALVALSTDDVGETEDTEDAA